MFARATRSFMRVHDSRARLHRAHVNARRESACDARHDVTGRREKVRGLKPITIEGVDATVETQAARVRQLV